MSHNTNEWLLKKYINADRTIVAQTAELKGLRSELEKMRHTAEVIQRVNYEKHQELLDRIKQMAPEKQFRVVFNGPLFQERLRTLSVSSANGVTTIAVERAV